LWNPPARANLARCFCNNNVLSGNTASNNEYGIFLEYSNNSVLTGNTASNNNVGIRLDHSTNNTVTGNTASNNSVAGIYLRSSSNSNAITGNNASNNNVGIHLYSSSNNVLFHNNLINNTVQANVTFGDANMWNDDYPSGGNYWSDYEERYPNATELDGSGYGTHRTSSMRTTKTTTR
jgi:parallel beta-helix repeat protein